MEQYDAKSLGINPGTSSVVTPPTTTGEVAPKFIPASQANFTIGTIGNPGKPPVHEVVEPDPEPVSITTASAITTVKTVDSITPVNSYTGVPSDQPYVMVQPQIIRRDKTVTVSQPKKPILNLKDGDISSVVVALYRLLELCENDETVDISSMIHDMMLKLPQTVLEKFIAEQDYGNIYMVMMDHPSTEIREAVFDRMFQVTSDDEVYHKDLLDKFRNRMLEMVDQRSIQFNPFK